MGFMANVAGACASELATDLLQKIDDDRSFTNLTRQCQVPMFSRNEIVLGDILGQGRFNSVYKIDSVCQMDSLTEENKTPKQLRRREKIVRRPGNYGVKFLSDETTIEAEDYVKGCLGLAVESKILSNLRHPHIIELRGISALGVEGFQERCEANFFLIFERLECTLSQKMNSWRLQESGMLIRLQVAAQLSDALCYLSRKRVLHRDIKPDNIGFTKDMQLKLFDFTFARVLAEKDDKFQLTAMVGTPYYMSPECANSEKYGMPSDVYSFSLLLWEIMSLKSLFEHCSKSANGHNVRDKNSTRKDRKFPIPLCDCVKFGTERDPAKRPTIEIIDYILKQQIDYIKCHNSIEELPPSNSYNQDCVTCV